MDNTPKFQRKSSLSLSTRLNKKRHSASPQSHFQPATENNIASVNDLKRGCDVPRSPSVHSVCSDGGIECTPPHKKPHMSSLDDMGDGDYSPKVFDNSFSPSCFLSQTMAVDSPEVGWKWKRHTDASTTRTPDSAYAADSSFTSAGSSSTEMMTNARARSDNYNRRKANDARREQELRRVEKTRAEEKLKQRCEKLQEQLKCVGAKKLFTNQVKEREESVIFISNSISRPTNIDKSSHNTGPIFKLEIPEKREEKICQKSTAVVREDTLDDFFNDSEADCFLLAATQEIESKIPTIINDNRSETLGCQFNSTSNSSSTSTSACITSSTSTTIASDTCTPLTKEKRSSFYMKFLEDDCTDDWFISLDEVVLQATQSKKPRNSLQRYNSMPTNSNDQKTPANKAVTKSDPMLNGTNSSGVAKTVPSLASHSKIKRHASSHTLSPADRQHQNRLKK